MPRDHNGPSAVAAPSSHVTAGTSVLQETPHQLILGSACLRVVANSAWGMVTLGHRFWVLASSHNVTIMVVVLARHSGPASALSGVA